MRSNIIFGPVTRKYASRRPDVAAAQLLSAPSTTTFVSQNAIFEVKIDFARIHDNVVMATAATNETFLHFAVALTTEFIGAPSIDDDVY